MNLNNINWNKDYDKFLNYLYSFQDLKYRDFHSKLILDGTSLIGIRTPILKNIAKEISKIDYLSFFQNNTHNTYEETILHGLVIGYLKIPFKEALSLLDDFIPYINNWAINDIVCANLKFFKKNLKEGFTYIKKLLKSNQEWCIRFGLVLLLDFYINDEYIDQILKICDEINFDSYYVKMANAWCLSICYIKYPDRTYSYLLNNHLDDFTFNKTISKICDSYRVGKEDKEKLKLIRKKK